ncbi:MAG: SixA phosphatase family protein [Kaistella sp.]
MKTLILVRHAKSDWPEDTDDFDRPLADRGLHDAEKMSAYMKQNNVEIEKFVSSPALRALSTCNIFDKAYQIGVETNSKLYNANESNFESVIYDLKDEVNSVAMFSHNNGISNFANMMSEEIFAFPTCGVAGFQVDCESWSEFESAKKKLLFFYEPKSIK